MSLTAAGNGSRTGAASRHTRTAWPAAATEGALRDGAVADLLLVDHPESTLTSFIGPAPEDLAQTTAELADRGVHDPVTERADAALARAAAMTGAQLYFVPDPDPAPEDGVCALLRVPDSAVG